MHGKRAEFPTLKAFRIIEVILAVATRSHVKKDSALLLGLQPMSSKLDAKLCLADPRRSDDDSHRTRDETASKHSVEGGIAGGHSFFHA